MTTIAIALDDLLNDRATPLEALIDRHFTVDYRQRTDGAWSTRTEFVQHIRHLREFTTSAMVTVLDELHSDDRYAERHRVLVTKRDGTSVEQEVYVFARRADDGRFRTLEELTVMLAGAESDRQIGSAR